MVIVTISIWPKGATHFGDGLLEALRAAYATSDGAGFSKDVLEIPVNAIEDCERVGAAVASWVLTTTEDFRLQISGPGAESEIRALRTDYDARRIRANMAAAAWLQ